MPPEMCVLTIRVTQANGSPAPFAIISVFKIVPFLWWQLWWHVTTVTANFYGETTVTLEKGVSYMVRAVWIGADARRRETTEPIKLNVCPYIMTVRLTW